ncbi:hypothetical protein G6027_03145 [Dietzia sp. SLG310A2-38A2]|uniref:hypothetical protein n=1 Tax=Dietzia sp. SLG310A2-38A2 TaxID=1630643 RepID=UPI0015FBF403|nr:hypothetical protein [Dietzia sp. SLG310A2-38A2]MBB1029904.1 hypothetical protein [Dietzia sp. SLG310A2-38A2]
MNRVVSVAATVALGAAAMGGGAGIARGQSFDTASASVSSVAPRALTLALDSADADGAAGTLGNNTDVDVECEVLVGPAALIRSLEENLAAGGGLNGPEGYQDALAAATTAGTVGVDLLELSGGQSSAWQVELSAAADFAAGAMALCGHEYLYVYEFAYESGGRGSLDLGSLPLGSAELGSSGS